MNFFESASRRGWKYTVEIIFNRLVPNWLFRCRRFVIYRLKANSPFDCMPGTVTSWCESENQYRIVEELTEFKRESNEGPVRAVQAMVENQVHGGFWVATESFVERELGVRILLGHQQCWLFAAMVSKQMRGRGIYSDVLRFMTSELDTQGFDDLLVAVNPDNKPSNYVHKKYSKSSVGTVFAIRFLNWAWCFSSSPLHAKTRFTANARLRPIELTVR